MGIYEGPGMIQDRSRLRTVGLIALVLLVLILVSCAAPKPAGQAPGARGVFVNPAGGGQKASKPVVNESAIAAEMAKLTPQERIHAEPQRFCAVLTTTRLGSMGPIIKETVNNQEIYLCCEGCLAKVKQNPARALTKAINLKAANAKQ
jgi:hypothetical protein